MCAIMKLKFIFHQMNQNTDEGQSNFKLITWISLVNWERHFQRDMHNHERAEKKMYLWRGDDINLSNKILIGVGHVNTKKKKQRRYKILVG